MVIRSVRDSKTPLRAVLAKGVSGILKIHPLHLLFRGSHLRGTLPNKGIINIFNLAEAEGSAKYGHTQPPK